ncbi:hypothetical protein LguiA_006686 [Lonicera macranthoides]
MKEEAVEVLSISQFLQSSRPFTGASSLNPNFPSKSSEKFQSLDETFEPFNPAPTLRNPNPKVLKPLNHPTILIGTLTLPSHQDYSTSNPSYFSFSDGSATICCDILDFELRLIGKRIHVLAWNFIPLKYSGGFLEIIRWILPESSNPDAFSLVSRSAIDCTVSSISRYYIHGALESVSPVSVVPCKMGVKSDTGPNSGGLGNVCGFLMHILVCDCKSCRSKDSVLHLQDTSGGQNSHCFTKSVIAYLWGSSSSWHPVFSRLIGNVVSLSGLKKKLVFIGKEESQLMYVTTEKALFLLPVWPNRQFRFQKTVTERQGGFGMYTGTVTSIYMQGMVVELDQEVLLVLTDQQLTLPLSLRAGAIVSVRNVHIVVPNFSWTKVLVLGACCKTSICVKSFSPMETGCCISSQSQSLMGKYINSLAFSARLWVLLVISCFRKKFSGILSEKQILGSKHKAGLVQKYSSSCLPLSVFRFRHGVFTEYCNHELCGCGNEQNNGRLKLVVPISNFINHCETTWMKMLLKQESVLENNQYSLLSCEGNSHEQSIRRVLQSEDIDVVLIGKLKISPSSGKLQLIDATGSIDVVIPELPSTWSSSIYEVHDFTVVVEGVPGQSDSLGTLFNESFLCRSIFNSVPLLRKSRLGIYLYYHLRDETSRNLPLCPWTDCKASTEEFGSGKFHLICVTHKFPVLQKFQGDLVSSKRSSIFAEAIILPWDLIIAEKDVGTYLTRISADYGEGVAHKRCKTDVASSGLCGEQICCNLTYPQEIPCFISGRSVEGHCVACSGTSLHCRQANLKITSGGKQGARKVLLEFESDSFCKYELLKIGGHYITKNHADLKSDKVVVTAKTHLWSILFSSDEIFLDESSTSDYRLPEGNLIPLNGFVVAVHGSNKSSLAAHLNSESCYGDVHQPKLFQGVTSSVCIHVLVRIFGSLSKNAYPTGFGPGVNATFHRILVGAAPLPGDPAWSMNFHVVAVYILVLEKNKNEELLKFVILNSCFNGPWVSSCSIHLYHNLNHKMFVQLRATKRGHPRPHGEGFGYVVLVRFVLESCHWFFTALSVRPVSNLAIGPVSGPVSLDESGEYIVLLGAPRTFYSIGLVFVPAGCLRRIRRKRVGQTSSSSHKSVWVHGNCLLARDFLVGIELIVGFGGGRWVVLWFLPRSKPKTPLVKRPKSKGCIDTISVSRFCHASGPRHLVFLLHHHPLTTLDDAVTAFHFEETRPRRNPHNSNGVDTPKCKRSNTTQHKKVTVLSASLLIDSKLLRVGNQSQKDFVSTADLYPTLSQLINENFLRWILQISSSFIWETDITLLVLYVDDMIITEDDIIALRSIHYARSKKQSLVSCLSTEA